MSHVPEANLLEGVAVSEYRATHQSFAGQLRRSVARSARYVGELRIFEFAMGFLFIFEVSLFFPLPLNQIAVIMLAAWGFMNRPRRKLQIANWLVPLLALALLYLAIVSAFADQSADVSDWKRRLIRLAVTCFALIFLVSGRLDFRSTLWGFATGLGANALLYFAGGAPNYYPGHLDGFLADKNVAGLAYAVGGILVLAYARTIPQKLLGIGLFAGLLWATGSRTSMFAFLAAVVWVFLAPHVGMVGRWLYAGITYWAVMIAGTQYARVGEFAEREGSDALRQRIDDASYLKVQEAGFFGNGLGEAYVRMEGHNWFFHNGYWSALTEGGWPWLAVVLIVTVVVGFQAFGRGKQTRQMIFSQAACLVTLVCAWRLGEVFFTIYWILPVALALIAANDARAGGCSEDMPARAQREGAPVSKANFKNTAVQNGAASHAHLESESFFSNRRG